MDYGSTLAFFKKESTPEKVVVLMDEPYLRAAVIAWKSVTISYSDDLEICESRDGNAQWNWLWSKVSFDKTRYQIVAGLKSQEVDNVFERLKGLKLIYPDGTIDLFAQQYLNSIIMKTIGTKKPEQKKS